MKVIVDFCVIPLGVGESLSPYIAECQRILIDMELNHSLHAYGTNIEGEWDAVMEAIKARRPADARAAMQRLLSQTRDYMKDHIRE